jgi:UDPglucose 6-dehydrogenase
MNIGVCGLGYVGLSNALLLAEKYKIIAYDIDKEKLEMLKNKISPIKDELVQQRLGKGCNVEWTDDFNYCVENSDCLIVATPTDYNDITNTFDTESVTSVVENSLAIKRDLIIIIKSTIPIGFTKKIKKRAKTDKIYFAPEFLREGKALYDNLYPSRIIVGGEKGELAKKISEMFRQAAKKDNVPVLLVNDTEAESIKLFANTYLALRVAYFNELDTFAQTNKLNTRDIIEGISLDERIGNFYNNPSFGYGGYCLPKDTKQLLSEYADTPNELIRSIVHSNKTRKDHIAIDISGRGVKTVGIYSLAMKSGSDNFRYSSTVSIVKRLLDKGIEILIYEPQIREKEFMGCPIVDLSELMQRSDLIITNRYCDELKDVADKVYTRDIFGRDS